MVEDVCCANATVQRTVTAVTVKVVWSSREKLFIAFSCNSAYSIRHQITIRQSSALQYDLSTFRG
jgi:hypothetical protein